LSVGLSLLYTILREDNVDLLMKVNPEGFQPEMERPVYDFVLSYYVAHKVLPPMSIVQRRWDYIIPAEGVADFWHTEFIKRQFGRVYDVGVNRINPIVASGNIDEAKSEIIKLSTSLTELQDEGHRPKTRQEIMEGVCISITERRSACGIIGVRTGWDILTRIVRGFSPKNLYVMAARKKIGKSQSLIHMSEAAYQAGHNVLVISMEMTEEEYCTRLASLVNKLSLNLLLSGKISTPMEGQIRRRIIEEAAKENRYSFKEGFFNISPLEIEQMIMADNPQIVFIDGAYLIRPQHFTAKMAGWEKVTEIVKDLKRIAGRHNVPLVATYQLNKKEEVHLSESIAQVATAVMGIYLMPDRSNARKIKVLDNRNGPRGEVTINFDFEAADFSEVDGSDEMNSDLSLFGEFEHSSTEE